MFVLHANTVSKVVIVRTCRVGPMHSFGSQLRWMKH